MKPSKFKTKKPEQEVPVRVNEKTTIMVKPGTDPQQAIENHLKRTELSRLKRAHQLYIN